MPLEFSNNTYFKVTKSDPSDKIDIEIGDSKQPDFYPQLKVKRWDNEANFSVRLITDEKSPSISNTTDKVSWFGDKTESHWYDIPDCDDVPSGGQEFDVVLKEKPPTNQIKFSIQSKGLSFEYQVPCLEQKLKYGQRATETQIIEEDGTIETSRNPNVNGSYAVFYSGVAGDFSRVGGKNYRSGKFGHIYRPKIFDATGKWVWGDINIADGIVTITIPQDFLDTATYPINHAAGFEFGNTTEGASAHAGGNTRRGARYILSEEGTVTAMHGFLSSNSGGTGVYGMAIYSCTGGTIRPPVNLLGNAVFGTFAGAGSAWREQNMVTNTVLSAGTYFLMLEGQLNYSYWGDNTATAYTAGSAGYRNPWSGTFGASSFSTTYLIAIHAVYGTGDGTTIPSVNMGLLTLGVGT